MLATNRMGVTLLPRLGHALGGLAASAAAVSGAFLGQSFSLPLAIQSAKASISLGTALALLNSSQSGWLAMLPLTGGGMTGQVWPLTTTLEGTGIGPSEVCSMT